MRQKVEPNRIVVEGNVAYLYIEAGRKTRGQIVQIDAEDVGLVRGYNRWCTAKTGDLSYVVTNVARKEGGFKTLYLHRLIMAQGENLKGKKNPDHINGNTMDNRKENLRLVTHGVNTSIGRKKNKRSIYRGVTIRHRKIKGTSEIRRYIVATPRVAKGVIMPMVCKTEKQAAIAYDIASVDYFKKNLLLEQLNFPEQIKTYRKVLRNREKIA